MSSWQHCEQRGKTTGDAANDRRLTREPQISYASSVDAPFPNFLASAAILVPQKTGFEDSWGETMRALRRGGKRHLGINLGTKKLATTDAKGTLRETNLGRCSSIKPAEPSFLGRESSCTRRVFRIFLYQNPLSWRFPDMVCCRPLRLKNATLSFLDAASGSSNNTVSSVADC